MSEERFATAAPLPDHLHRLHELALDLWWSWDDRARQVFRRLDYTLWRATAHNPVRMLQQITPERLANAAADPEFLKAYDEAIFGLDQARTVAHPWWRERASMLGGGTIAYFSAEFALHQSLPIYAGGLGVLAGDHCKEAADLGLPFVGIGFMYPQGYFRQRMTNDGWQEERYEKISWTDSPIETAITPDGRPCITAIPLGDRTVLAAVWRVRLGRVRLFLLDTDLSENAPWDRELSARLYGGDRETRIQQEIILGIGGVRALRAMGIAPTVWHLNEGHAAFVALQRIREMIEQGRSFDDALEEVKRSTVFTTHTPVPAGHDAFPFNLVEKYLAGTWGEIGQHRQNFLALGEYDNGSGSLFNMTALALRTSQFVNGVSALHGEVTRSMWRPMWPETPADQLPVRSITNGVHVPTWMAGPVFALLDTHFGPGWLDHVDEPELWERLNDIPDAEIWQMRQMLRMDLFAFIRERMRTRFSQEHVSQSRIVSAGPMLDPEALTLGYARRFTAYKRPEMIFHDADRLARILTHLDRPVQIVFAGKAHPGRRAREAQPAAGVQARARSQVRRPPRLHRGLRHARGALPGAGLRRVAEQSAQAAGSQRHQRHEGVAERRAAPQHRRRLVGRRVQRPQWLADRGPGQSRRSRRDGRRRRQRAVRVTGKRGGAGLLRPRPGRPRPAAALDRDRA